MRHINGVCTQRFNRRHAKVGYLFHGHFKAVQGDRDAYLLEVFRYVEVNPERGGMVAAAMGGPWPSYRSHVGEVASPCWSDAGGLSSHLLERDLWPASDRRQGERQYEQLVSTARDLQSWDLAWPGQATYRVESTLGHSATRVPRQMGWRGPECLVDDRGDTRHEETLPGISVPHGGPIP